MMAHKEQEKKHADDETMIVDKKMLSTEEQFERGGLHVANSDDSRTNYIESESFEDQHQHFRLEPKPDRDTITEEKT